MHFVFERGAEEGAVEEARGGGNSIAYVIHDWGVLGDLRTELRR